MAEKTKSFERNHDILIFIMNSLNFLLSSYFGFLFFFLHWKNEKSTTATIHSSICIHWNVPFIPLLSRGYNTHINIELFLFGGKRYPINISLSGLLLYFLKEAFYSGDENRRVCALGMDFDICTCDAEQSISTHTTNINTDCKRQGNSVGADYKGLKRQSEQ